jgi:phosphohistidine phosphatase
VARAFALDIVILRHGIAADRDAQAYPHDPGRPLTPRGRRRVAGVVRALAARGVAPVVILSSPYLRAVQTAEIAAEAFGIAVRRIETTEALAPMAAPGVILRQLARRKQGPVLLVGHAPHLDRLIAQCLTGSADPVTALRKGAVACLRLERLRPLRARLEWLVTARLMRKARA